MKRTTPIKEAQLQKMRSIVEFFGKGLWKGDLSEMRDDHPRRKIRQKKVARSTRSLLV